MHSFVITTCHFRSSVHQGKWVLICESDVAITSLDEAMHSDKVLADEERSSLSSAYDLLGYYGHSRRLLTYHATNRPQVTLQNNMLRVSQEIVWSMVSSILSTRQSTHQLPVLLHIVCS